MPREVKAMQAARAVESKMKEFKESLPLFVDLKHDALRDRSVNMLNDGCVRYCGTFLGLFH